MRKIAERIEYSPAAIYGYFPSKDDIFFALAEEGFRLLIGQTSLERAPSGAQVDPLYCIRQALMRVSSAVAPHIRPDVPDRSVPRITGAGAVGLCAIRLQVDALTRKRSMGVCSRPDAYSGSCLPGHGVAVALGRLPWRGPMPRR
jgi:AcrR family transcriptional regulator